MGLKHVNHDQPAVTHISAAVHRRVAVRGSGGVTATIVVFARQGTVLVSISPPFTWEAIMDPEQVDELIRALGLAQDDATKMLSARESPVGRGTKAGICRSAEPSGLAVRRSSS